MTFMDLVSEKRSVTIERKWVHSQTQLHKKIAADKGHSVLQYNMTIIAYMQQLLDMEGLFGTSANCIVGI